jgi:hypothetical protein
MFGRQFGPLFLWSAFLMASPVSILQGVVTDTSGASVPGAKIVLIAQDGTTQTTVADRRGAYLFPGVSPGDYTVQSSAPQLVLTEPVQISLVPGTQTLNLQLSVAPIAERVEVDSDAPPTVGTEPDSNATALVVRGSDLDALSDNSEDLLADLQALAGPSAGPSGGSVYIDGFSGGDLPSKQSIREVRINQNPFSPEYDKLGLGRIEVITKPGSARFHGNLNYNIDTDYWNTRNPYSAVKAPLLLNEFENTITGPINKHASFTLDANQNDIDNGSLVNAVTVAPQSLTTTPFFDIFKTIQRRTRLYPRIDYQLNDKNTLTLRYSFIHGDILGAGIGGFDLISRGYHTRYTTQTVQVIESRVLGGNGVNESRFQYYRNASQMIPNSLSPEIQVLGSFNGGGAQIGHVVDAQDNFEFQNNTTLARGLHTWRFGVRARLQRDNNASPLYFNGVFTFGGGIAPALNAANLPVLDSSGQPVLTQIGSIEAYRRTLLFESLGMPPGQIRKLGGGATQFSISTGNPRLLADQADVGVFAGDDWQIRPNLTLSLGLRYETQTNIQDWRDLAPRVGLAWAPGGGRRASRPKLVLRAGFGIFYDRFSLANTLTADRYNGIVQQEYVITNPDFFPTVPTGAALSALPSTPVIQQVSANLRAPHIVQSALTLERQLPRNTTLAATYTNSQGLNMLRSQDINAPLPGTYIAGIQNSGAYPLGRPGAVFLMESSGIYDQNQFIVNVNSRMSQSISLSASYVLNRALSDTDGVTTFPGNPYNLSGEYGPAATDARHKFTLSGTIDTKWNIRFSPFVTVQSGLPFDITTGSDLYGTTLLNSRPGVATDLSRPGLIESAYGLLDPNPTSTETLIGRNYGRGPGQMSVNLRIGKTIGFGPQRESDAAGKRRPPGWLHGIFTEPANNQRYRLTISASVRNLFNHNNPGPIIGNITSPIFGRANQMAGNVNGEGFSENANSRRTELQTRFTF